MSSYLPKEISPFIVLWRTYGCIYNLVILVLIIILFLTLLYYWVAPWGWVTSEVRVNFRPLQTLGEDLCVSSLNRGSRVQIQWKWEMGGSSSVRNSSGIQEAATFSIECTANRAPFLSLIVPQSADTFSFFFVVVYFFYLCFLSWRSFFFFFFFFFKVFFFFFFRYLHK